MLTVFARPFVLLGEQIHEMRAMFIFGEGKPLSVEDLQELQEHLTAVLDICENLDLSVSKELITDAKSDPPNNEREFAVLTKALYAEIRNKLLVVVPPHRRKFYTGGFSKFICRTSAGRPMPSYRPVYRLRISFFEGSGNWIAYYGRETRREPSFSPRSGRLGNTYSRH